MNLKEFSDSLKKVFGSLLPLKTADSNYAVGLFNKADGTPAGMMDMPALASVLGGIIENKVTVGYKINTGGSVTMEVRSNACGLLFCSNSARGSSAIFAFSAANIEEVVSDNYLYFTPTKNGSTITWSCTANTNNNLDICTMYF